jgi:dynein heavy chain
MKKRDFYKYDCGREMAQKKLDAVFGEIADFESKITDYGYISAKLTTGGNLIENAFKMVDTIKIEVTNMKGLWDHISYCQQIFTNNLAGKWEVINCGEMEDEVKKLQKTLKEMKVDKKTNAYNGLLEEVKKWLLFLPLIAELRDPSMRERHWQKLRDRVQVNFVVDSKFTLRDIWNLNLNKYAEDVEETTDQAKQEAKMEKTLNKLNETWKDIKF